MNRIALILICFAFSSAVLAGPGQHRGGHDRGPPSAEQRVAWMNEKLALTDDQSVRLLEIMQSAEAEREELRARAEEEFKPEMCALHDRVSEEVGSILDAEQAALLEEHMARRDELSESRGKGKRRHGPGWLDCAD